MFFLVCFESVPLPYYSDAFFLDDQLRDLLRELLLILSSRHLPTPNSKKTWDLAAWTLTSQRLHPDILLSQKPGIQNVLNRLVQGNFDGYSHICEGLKVCLVYAITFKGT